MGKHTPGPWIVTTMRDEVASRYQCAVVEAENPGGRILAVSDYADDQDKANASLIAAAPDLLEAAKAIINEYLPHRRVHTAPTWEQLDALYYAIAKAEAR